MEANCPRVVTGQQIGAGWTPALSVIKALAALAAARTLGGKALYWMADEDHDHLEVASTVGVQKDRLLRHRFRFQAPQGTATGWLPWMNREQREAEDLWGETPKPLEPTLRSHVRTLGEPLWKRGLEPFSPTDPKHRNGIQDELLRWRSLDLESRLNQQARHLELQGQRLVLDPRNQNAWFCLDPRTGSRRPLEHGQACPKGHWLSPGAALRPLMQTLLLHPSHAVLGPAERAYWQLTEPLWERVGLEAPQIIPRPSVYIIPRGSQLSVEQLPAVKAGDWEAFAREPESRPSQALNILQADPTWGPELGERFQKVLAATQLKLQKLDRRLHRDRASRLLGMDPERLRQHLFPFEKPQERVLPGIFWLRDEALLDRILEALEQPEPLLLVEES